MLRVPSSKRALVPEQRLEAGKEPMLHLPRANLAVFISTSETAIQEQMKLEKTLGVIYPSHGNPSTVYMMEGLRAVSEEFKKHSYLFHKNSEKYLTHFPSSKGLSYAASRTSVPCRDHKVGFRVSRWKGNEDDRFFTFQTKAWLAIHGIPLHH